MSRINLCKKKKRDEREKKKRAKQYESKALPAWRDPVFSSWVCVILFCFKVTLLQLRALRFPPCAAQSGGDAASSG